MSKFIKVICKTPDKMGGTHTPHRYWPGGETRTLEVVPDAPTVAWLNAHRPERRGNEDRQARALQIAGGPYLPDGQPDPERITESGVRAIEACPHLSYLGEGGDGGAMHTQTLDVARQLLERSNEKAATLEIQVVQLSTRVADLQAELDKAGEERVTVGKQLAELMQENEALRKRAGGEGADEGADDETDDGKGGKNKAKGKGGK